MGLNTALHLAYDAAVTLDTDGQHDVADALRLASWGSEQQLVDTLVLGVRNLTDAQAPRANRFSNWISNFFLSRFTGCPLLDTQCGLRRYPLRKTLSLDAYAPGYGWEAQVIIRACQQSIPIEQVPVDVRYGAGTGRSHFHNVQDPVRIIRAVFGAP